MDIVREKKRLLEQLAKTEDVDIIQKVKDVLNSSNQKDFIGYNPDGSEISELELIRRAEIANQSIKEGRTKSTDQVREEMKKW
jgi:hypothetical protein